MYLNNEADFTDIARYESGKLYLPADYVTKNINSRLFFSESDGMLSYTLPDRTDDIMFSEDRGGAAAVIEHDGRLYVQADLVTEYSQAVLTAFCDDAEPAKRVFIDISGSSQLTAEVRHKTYIYTKRDVKSPVLISINKGETVKVTDQNEQWSSIVTERGYSGFVRTRTLGDTTESTVPDNYTEPEVTHTLLSETPVMAWHGVYGFAGNDDLDKHIETAGGHINVLSPTWIQIKDGDGNYVNYSSSDYIAKAHAAGCKVWVSVDNFNQPSAVNGFDTKTFFESSEKRRGFIAKLMAEASNYGYDGFNLDFEGIASDAGASYAQFFRELSVECRKAGLVLSIDNYVPYDFNDFYRMDEQGVFADYVVVMLYDEHTSEPGSNSSLPFVDYGLDEARQDVAAERIIAGLPLYTRLWSTDEAGNTSSQTMGLTAARQYASDKGMTLNWDEAVSQYYGEFQDGPNLRQLWLEDEASLEAKMNAVKENAAGGIAVWRLGYDTAEIWNVLDSGL